MKRAFAVVIDSDDDWNVGQIAKLIDPEERLHGFSVSEVDIEKSPPFIFTDQLSRWPIGAHGERKTTVKNGRKASYG